jgi:hypothetical protein
LGILVQSGLPGMDRLREIPTQEPGVAQSQELIQIATPVPFHGGNRCCRCDPLSAARTRGRACLRSPWVSAAQVNPRIIKDHRCPRVAWPSLRAVGTSVPRRRDRGRSVRKDNCDVLTPVALAANRSRALTRLLPAGRDAPPELPQTTKVRSMIRPGKSRQHKLFPVAPPIGRSY